MPPVRTIQSKTNPPRTCSSLAPPPLPVSHYLGWRRTRPHPNTAPATPCCAPANQSVSLSGRSQATGEISDLGKGTSGFWPSCSSKILNCRMKSNFGKGSWKRQPETARDGGKSFNFINYENRISQARRWCFGGGRCTCHHIPVVFLHHVDTGDQTYATTWQHMSLPTEPSCRPAMYLYLCMNSTYGVQ